MSRGVDLLVATPGRLIDLIEQRYVNLSMLEILVLDEADQMLDLGFIHALRRIVTLLPKQRQSLFFSATMPKTIRTLADQFLRDPARSEEHTSELQSLMRISYAVFCLKKKKH